MCVPSGRPWGCSPREVTLAVGDEIVSPVPQRCWVLGPDHRGSPRGKVRRGGEGEFCPCTPLRPWQKFQLQGVGREPVQRASCPGENSFGSKGILNIGALARGTWERSQGQGISEWRTSDACRQRPLAPQFSGPFFIRVKAGAHAEMWGQESNSDARHTPHSIVPWLPSQVNGNFALSAS